MSRYPAKPVRPCRHCEKPLKTHQYVFCSEACGMAPEWQGAPLVFVLDHVDGNSSDNSRANVRLICPNCDSQLPTYKARNRGNGRHARRIRYANGQSF